MPCGAERRCPRSLLVIQVQRVQPQGGQACPSGLRAECVSRDSMDIDMQLRCSLLTEVLCT